MNYLHAILGGLMIGSAALLMYAALGRIAGISGITFGFFERPGDRVWRLFFLMGLIIGPWMLVHAGFEKPAGSTVTGTGDAWIAVAGLLVGVGTRWGNGCTSGHGVCGLARLSPRSMVAVAIFMGAGILTATFLRPLLI